MCLSYNIDIAHTFTYIRGEPPSVHVVVVNRTYIGRYSFMVDTYIFDSVYVCVCVRIYGRTRLTLELLLLAHSADVNTVVKLDGGWGWKENERARGEATKEREWKRERERGRVGTLSESESNRGVCLANEVLEARCRSIPPSTNHEMIPGTSKTLRMRVLLFILLISLFVVF